MQKRKTTKKERKAQRQAERAARGLPPQPPRGPRPTVSLRVVGQDISIEEIVEIMTGPNVVDYGSMGLDDCPYCTCECELEEEF